MITSSMRLVELLLAALVEKDRYCSANLVVIRPWPSAKPSMSVVDNERYLSMISLISECEYCGTILHALPWL